MVNCLNFNRPVQKQKGLRKDERGKNVIGAMDCSSSLTGLTVYLVDDVYTTGSTMNEACRVVTSRGASHVFGLVAGRDSNLESLVTAGVLTVVED